MSKPPGTSKSSQAAVVYAALLDAVDGVLEEGVPRRTLVDAGLSSTHVEEWVRVFAHAEEVVRDWRQRRSARGSRALRTRLVVLAASLDALARQAGLTGTHAAFGGLRVALDQALAYARAAHDEALRQMLAEPA